MILKTIEGLIFLSYLTKYNIGEIYRALEFLTFDDYYNSSNVIDGVSIRNAYTDQQIRSAISEAMLTMDKDRFYKIFHVSYFSQKYPRELLKIKNPPPILYVKGKLPSQKIMAIVGTRKPTKFAFNKIDKLVKDGIDLGFGIGSGLAIGVDSMAHEAALRYKGYTIAVMPNSLDSVYPKENYKLASSILDSDGALITEIPIGVNRGKMSFIERNRIQTALSDFVIPIEMTINSGTMHTVRFAKAQSKKLILLEPEKDSISLKEYEGIVHLIDKDRNAPSNNVLTFNDTNAFREYLLRNDNNSIQLDLRFPG